MPNLSRLTRADYTDNDGRVISFAEVSTITDTAKRLGALKKWNASCEFLAIMRRDYPLTTDRILAGLANVNDHRPAITTAKDLVLKMEEFQGLKTNAITWIAGFADNVPATHAGIDAAVAALPTHAKDSRGGKRDKGESEAKGEAKGEAADFAELLKRACALMLADGADEATALLFFADAWHLAKVESAKVESAKVETRKAA